MSDYHFDSFDTRLQRSYRPTPAPSNLQGGSMVGEAPRALPARSRRLTPALSDYQESMIGETPRGLPAYNNWTEPANPCPQSYPSPAPAPFPAPHYPPQPLPARHYEEASPVSDPAYAWGEFVILQQKFQKLEDKVTQLQDFVVELSQSRVYVPSRLRPSTPSLGPSDSISRVGSTSQADGDDGEEELLAAYQTYLSRPEALEKPDWLPDSVLWTFKSAQELGVLTGFSAKNNYRPSFTKALRDSKGNTLDQGIVKLIKRTAGSLTDRILALHPLDKVQINVKQVREYYRSEQPDLWYGAIMVLKRRHKEVVLCSAHWKADHLLSQSITSARQKVTKKQSNGEPSSHESNDERCVPITPKKFKRPANAITPLPAVPPSKQTRMGDKPRPAPRPLYKHHTKATPKAPSSTALSGDYSRPTSPTPSNKFVPSAAPFSPTFSPSLLSVPSSSSVALPPSSSSVVTSTSPSQVFPNVPSLSMITTDNNCTIQSAEFAFSEELIHPTLELLAAMELFPRHGGHGFPSDDVSTLLNCVQTAEPACMESKEDLQDSWGHWQWSSGSLTIASAITSWSTVGNMGTARQLIAATLTTCKAARYLCMDMNKKPSTYLSDAYLDRVISTLMDVWKRSGRPLGKGKVRAAVSEPVASTSRDCGDDDDEINTTANGEEPRRINDNAEDPPASTSSSGDVALQTKLEELHLPELKTLVIKRQIPNTRTMNKATCVSSLFALTPPTQPTIEELDEIITKRAKKGKGSKGSNNPAGKPEDPDQMALPPRLIAKATN